MKFNGIDNPDEVYVGQVLQLSAAAAVSTATPTVAPTSTTEATAMTSPLAPPPVYTVRSGETLSEIAKRYGIELEALMAVNSIDDANAIYEGQRLRMPGVEPEAPPTLAPAARPTVHTVQPGETLSGIARLYGIPLQALKDINQIGDADAIYEGQELKLSDAPEADATPDATETAQPEQSVATATLTPTVAIAEPVERSGNPVASLNRSYTVRSGDTLGLIALRLGVNAESLRALNSLESVGSPLNAGQVLLLPATGDDLRPKTPAQEYIVQAGQSLGQIAQAHGLTVGDLLSANRIADPNSIYPGQHLVIPSRALSGRTSGPPEVQVGPARSGYFYYTVQPGDTLSELAKQFNSTMLAIRDYNNLPDNETVYAGLELRVPYGAPPLPLRVPPAPLSGTRFVVSLSRQQCWVYQGDKVLHSWNCSTGYGDWKTKTGNYAVQSKIANAKSNAYRLDMPYWLGIYDVGQYENGIHGLPMAWKTGKKIWETLVGEPATFGCAMLDDLEAATLYRLAYLGMPVHIVN